jgi:hypothetical protein
VTTGDACYRGCVRALAVAGVVLIAVLVAIGSRVEAQAASATPVRLVLVSPPAELEAAVRAALAPWRVAIIVEPGEPPRDAATAAVVAERHRANAVAWVDVGSMRVFEPGATDLVARPVDEIDEASAASLALTLKTLLRLPPLPPEPEPEPLPVEPAPAVIRAAAPRRAWPWRLSAMAGARARSEGVEPRLTVIGERRIGPIAVAVSGSLGQGHDIVSADFRGTWRDTVGGVAILLPIERAGWRLAAGAGLSLHVVTLDGAFTGNNDSPGDHRDLGLGIDGEIEIVRRWGRLGVGVRACASAVSFRDRVATRGSNAVDVAPAEGEVGVVGAFSF